jgi:hypothetical protein
MVENELTDERSLVETSWEHIGVEIGRRPEPLVLSYSSNELRARYGSRALISIDEPYHPIEGFPGVLAATGPSASLIRPLAMVDFVWYPQGRHVSSTDDMTGFGKKVA